MLGRLITPEFQFRELYHKLSEKSAIASQEN